VKRIASPDRQLLPIQNGLSAYVSINEIVTNMSDIILMRMKEMASLNVIESNGNLRRKKLLFSRTITCPQTLLWQDFIMASSIHGSATLKTGTTSQMLPYFQQKRTRFAYANKHVHVYIERIVL